MVPRASVLIVAIGGLGVAAADASARHVVVIAHRGAHDRAPENSLAAIRQAAAIGCDYVEVDVRITRDGKLVLMHDSTVDRMTDGRGAVREMSLADIRRLRLKSPVQPGDGGLAERVPTFEEAVEACKEAATKIYVDHKVGSVESVEAVLAIAKKHEMLDRMVVYSAPVVLREFKNRCPQVWIMPPHPQSEAGIRKLAADLKPETLDGNLRDWSDEHVAAAHQAGCQVWVDNLGKYDNLEGFQRAIRMNVDAIQTDHPRQLVEFLTAEQLR